MFIHPEDAVKEMEEKTETTEYTAQTGNVDEDEYSNGKANSFQFYARRWIGYFNNVLFINYCVNICVHVALQ